MLKKFNLIVLGLFLTLGGVFAQDGSGIIKGVVVDESKGNAPIYGAIVVLKQNGNEKGKRKTQDKGQFRFDNLSAGKYEIIIGYATYPKVNLTDIVVKSEGVVFLGDIKMGLKKTQTVVIKKKPPLINPSGPSITSFTAEDMENMGTRNVNDVVAQSAAVTKQEGDESGVNIKGSSTDGNLIMMDGVKVRSTPNLPKGSMQEVSVITGGVPANYGDAVGGVISITTKGPTAYYFGGAEIQSSGLYLKGKDPNGYDGKVFGLDKYGYNLFEGLFSGPLWMKKDSTGKKTSPILGFMITANYTNVLDGRPLANGGAYRIKKESRDYLLENPLRIRPDGQLPVSNAEFLTKDDFEQNPWRMNASSSNLSGTAKISVKLPQNMNLVFGGNFSYSNSMNASRQFSLMNFSNNGVSRGGIINSYVRFSQYFSAKESKEGVKPLIQSAGYNLMIDYTNSGGQTYDERFKFDAFKYGHVGTFNERREADYGFNSTTSTYELQGFKRLSVDFVPNPDNMELAATTIQYYNLFKNQPGDYFKDLDKLREGKALINGSFPASISSPWTTLGTPYNSIAKTNSEQFRVTGSGNAIIGEHAITIGFEFEKRWQRGWSVNNPAALWTVARQFTNSHINFIGTEIEKIEQFNGYNKITYKPINASYAASNGGVYGGDKNQDEQTFFDYNLRNKLNLPGGGANSSYIDLFSLDPSLLSVDMFSQDQLLDKGLVSYYGYDIAGNKVSGNTSVQDYFTAFDKNNNYKRFIGAYQPVYVAGYIMDKFAVNNLVFNVGVRVDVFDANQPVLKDPYLLYQARTAGEVRNLIKENPQTYSWAVVPGSISDNSVVYIDDLNNPSKINGFRSGSQWYSANGNPTDKSSEVRGPNGITPWLLDPKDKQKNVIKSEVFKNYTPQVNVMPRLAFSFPIAEKAAFTAHYDILTKRPDDGATRFDPTQYQFLSNSTDPSINNPELKPKQTIDYEVGFQQELSQNSALKIAGFYREQRNDIQQIRIIDAYPSSYTMWGNIDFGTVKGLTLSYDLRRVNNLRMTANYTLQFAEGTGASPGISSKVTSIGYNFRYIFPYSYDIRHQLNIVADYRYDVKPGKKYEGPMIGKFELLKNTGLNITTNIYSGSPYSAAAGPASALNPGLTGTVNGSRLPWTYRLDLVLDRNFVKEIKKSENEEPFRLNINVYLRATNLFNQLNLLDVYPGTGSWKDDGFLAAAQNQNAIQQQLNVESFKNYYTMWIQDPYKLSAPRTLRLGVRIDF